MRSSIKVKWLLSAVLISVFICISFNSINSYAVCDVSYNKADNLSYERSSFKQNNDVL